MENSIAKLDLTKLLFGRTRSQFVMFEENNQDREERRPREGRIPRQEYPVQLTDPNDTDFKSGLYFAMCAQGGASPRRRGLLDIVPSYDGKPLKYEYTATPSMIRLDTDKGTIKIIIDTPKTMRIKGEGVGAQLYLTPPYMSMMNALELPSGVVECNLRSVYAGGGVFFFKSLKGKVTIDTRFDPAVNGPAYINTDFLPDENGEFEIAVYSRSPDEWGYIDYKPFDECEKEIADEFDAFLQKLAGVPAEFEALRGLSAYSMWIHYQPKSDTPIMPTLMSDMIYSDILREGQARAYEQPLYSMAFSDPRAAAELITNNLAHMKNGMLPTTISGTMPCYRAFPPTFGAAVLNMLKNGGDKLAKDEIKAIYEPLAEHCDWWLKSHSLAENRVSYNSRGEYAFSGASYGVWPFPLETPDLYSYMILFTEALSKLAELIGDSRAGEWSAKSKALLESLLTLWDGERFMCKGAISGEMYKSESLLACMPVILGKRLPGEVLAGLTALLGSEETYLSKRGFRSESKTSEFYDAEKPGRGAVDAALQMLITGGLFEAGETELAKKAARALIGAMREQGVRDCLVSEGEQPMRRPANEFNAIGGAALIYLANSLGEFGKES